MVEFYYNNFNFCESYYSPKLLATLKSNLQICKLCLSCFHVTYKPKHLGCKV